MNSDALDGDDDELKRHLHETHRIVSPGLTRKKQYLLALGRDQ